MLAGRIVMWLGRLELLANNQLANSTTSNKFGGNASGHYTM
ncbi:MAG: hypothetical protein OEX02_19165 [Cyclobacteriaceae bacterium]|nr:hypothetical protein [Cyclobacteriaceae bacterium]